MPEGQHMSLTRNPEVLPEELLEEYEPQGKEPLGEGAFAVVRLLRRRKTGELFALKCVEKYPLQIRNMIGQMQREVRIHKALSHPNILQLVRVFDDSSYLFMLLEYCEKGPLRVIVAEAPNGRLTEPEAVFYFDQIVKGVEWMHRNCCVHRDLKLENMLLTAKDELKICDFGWSAEVETDRLLKTTCGTTAYWPPELWDGEAQDESVDMWALGCLLYEMLAGHPPFLAREKQELSSQVMNVQFAYPPWFSNEACHCVHSLLQREPRKRMRSKDLMRHNWLRKHAAEAVPVQSVALCRASSSRRRPSPPPAQVACREEAGAVPQQTPTQARKTLLPPPRLTSESMFPAAGASSESGPRPTASTLHVAPPPAPPPPPQERRPGTVERRIVWEVTSKDGSAVRPMLTAAPMGSPSSRCSRPTPGVLPAAISHRADFPRSPVVRASSKGVAPPATSPARLRTTPAPPPRATDPFPTNATSHRLSVPASAEAAKEAHTASPLHSRWPNGTAARAPAEPAPSQTVSGRGRYGGSTQVVASSLSPTRGHGGTGRGFGPAVLNSPTSLRLPLPSAQSFHAPQVFASSEASSTPLGSTILPTGKAQSFSVQSPSTSFFLQSVALSAMALNTAPLTQSPASTQVPTPHQAQLPTSPAARSPAPQQPAPPQSPLLSQPGPGTPLAHSGSGSIATASTRSGNGGFFSSTSGSIVVRQQPPLQCNYYAGSSKPKVFLPLGSANDSFALEQSMLSPVIAV